MTTAADSSSSAPVGSSPKISDGLGRRARQTAPCLLFAAAESGDPVAGAPVLSHPLQQLPRPWPESPQVAGDPGGQGHLLPHRQVGQQAETRRASE